MSFRRAKILVGFCLSGCFSKPQYMVFVAWPASARSTLRRDRRPAAGLVRPSMPEICPGRARPVKRGATGPQARRSIGLHLQWPTTISGGLLKQPDKHEPATISPWQTIVFRGLPGCEACPGLGLFCETKPISQFGNLSCQGSLAAARWSQLSQSFTGPFRQRARVRL